MVTPALGPSSSGGPEVVFTFEDGPHEEHTSPILDALAQHGVSAIFFVTGWRIAGTSKNADTRRALLARTVRERHTIGNHTVHHAHMCTIKREKGEW